MSLIVCTMPQCQTAAGCVCGAQRPAMTDTTHPQERDIARELDETGRTLCKGRNVHGEDIVTAGYLMLDAAALLTRLRTQPSPRECVRVLELWSSAAADLKEITPDTYQLALKEIAKELAALPVSVSPREVALEKALQKIATYFSEEGKIATAALASSAGEKYDMG